MPGSALHPAASAKHFVVFNYLIQIICGVGGRDEDNESVRDDWCPTEENFTVGALTGWSKQLKNDLLARKADSIFFLTNGPWSAFITSHQLGRSRVKLRSL